MSKRKLDAEFDFDMAVIGLICPTKEYKLAWLLNRHLPLHLVKLDDAKIELKGEELIAVSNFIFESKHAIFRLLKNKLPITKNSQKAYLVNSLSQFDYFLTIDDRSDNFEAEPFKAMVNQIDEVQFATLLDINKITERDNLVF